ncbi:MAG: excinuclease ABC subunit UvrC [Candidatus Liptonbacteria bacterium]|nr:excinuclease ABC subunit UvrC [Candidatus Liptonbacteria bacterium]
MEKKKLYERLPESAGVYLMKDARGKILYIGKAGNLKRRVSSYFQKAHDYRIERLLAEVKEIAYKKTDTAIEALILESGLIKKYKPPYNVREKDDTSFLFVEFTREKFPRVLLVRGKTEPRGERFGPFTSATSIRQALRILRRIFPFSVHPAGVKFSRPCFEYEIGLCPGICIGAIRRADYMKNIRNLKLFFEGKKNRIMRNLQKEMETASKKLEFEKAAQLRGKIFALQHIQDVALISEADQPATSYPQPAARIEGYDISNISGTSAVGSMVVFAGGKPDRDEYRKFKIRTIQQSDDVGMLKEVLRRRFQNDWPLPDLVLVDGGRGQVNAARQVTEEYGVRVPVVGIAKGPARRKNEFIGVIPGGVARSTLIRVRDEAHRFAIQYHTHLRGKKFLESRHDT